MKPNHLVTSLFSFLTACALTNCTSASHCGPAYDAAVRNLTSQIEGVSVNATWVMAFRHGPKSSPFSVIDYLQCRYSGSRVTSDGVFHVHLTGKNWGDSSTLVNSFNSDVAKSIRKNGRAIVHNRRFSLESEAVSEAERRAGTPFGGLEMQSLVQNLNDTWIVELVANSGKKSSDYFALYFPTRQKAEAFAEAWRTLAAMLK